MNTKKIQNKKYKINNTLKSLDNHSILCNLSYSNNIPEKDAIILSCSLFKLNDMYRDITIYINGLKKIVKWIENNKHKLHLYIYYDHSIENDNLFLDLKPELDKKKNITTCKYYCETFIDSTNGLHKGLFGLFVRFYPFFNTLLLKNIKLLIDIDIADNYLFIIENCILPQFIKSNTKCFILDVIGYEWTYYNLYSNQYTKGSANSNFYLKNMCLPIKLLNNTLIKLRNNDPKILTMINEIVNKKKDKLNTLNKKHLFYDAYKKFKDNKTFSYGIDEWWLNKIVLDYIIETEKEIGIIYYHDSLAKYFNNKLIEWKLNKNININNFLKELLKDKYNTNFNINLKTLYRIFNFDNYNTINDYHKYIKLTKKLFFLIEKNKKNKLLIINNNYFNNLKTHITYNHSCFSKINTYNTKKDKQLFNYLCKTKIPILKFKQNNKNNKNKTKKTMKNKPNKQTKINKNNFI